MNYKTFYRVVSDRREYGLFDTYGKAQEVLSELCCESYFMGSDEDFWIEFEDE